MLSLALSVLPAKAQTGGILSSMGLANTSSNAISFAGQAEGASQAMATQAASVAAAETTATGLQTSACSSQNYGQCIFYGGVVLLAGYMLLSLGKSQQQAEYAKQESTHNEGNKATPTHNPLTDPQAGVNTVVDSKGQVKLAEAEKRIKAMEKKGFKYNPKTKKMTFPNGKTATVSTIMDLKNASGISDKEFSSFQSKSSKAAEEAQKKLAAGADGTDSFGDGSTGGGGGGGGGGGSSARSTASADALPGMGGLGGMPAADAAAGPTDVSGLSKKYGDSQIGVGPSNIFSNLKNRYDVHERQGSFLVP